MLIRFLRDIDYVAMLLALSLAAIGITVIYGLSSDMAEYRGLWERQTCFAAVGLVIMLLVSAVDYRRVVSFAWVFYVLTLVLLILTALYGTEKHGAKSWLGLPGLPITIQTSEFAKLGVILMVVWILGRMESRIHAVWQCILPLGTVLVPLLLVLKQPDLGTALVFVPVSVGLLVLVGVPWPVLALLLSPVLASLAIAARTLSPGYVYVLTWLIATGAVLIWAWRGAVLKMEVILVGLLNVGLFAALTLFWPALWNALEPHQQKRILVYTDPEYDPSGAGWQVEQSKIAIGSGGPIGSGSLFGKGVGRGTQSHLNFLPETPTDFVFAVLAEEWGFFGGSVLLVLFGMLILRGLQVARRAPSVEGTLLAGGIVFLFFTHLTINLGMTMGLLPVTGLPLSFISYGGSALFSNLIGVGLLMSVYRYRKDS